MLDIKVPTVGESINEVTLAKWLVKEGDLVQQDQILCELESDKATFELNAEKPGKISLKADTGTVLKIGDVVCSIDTSIEVPAAAAPAPKAEAPKATPAPSAAPAPAAAPTAATGYAAGTPSPAAGKMMAENNLATKDVTATGVGGRITKADVLDAMKKGKSSQAAFTRNARREKMTTLRKTIAKHLVNAKNSTAMLTTFNEVDMKPIMDIRAKYKDTFKETHGVNLGFMSFFCRACVLALQEWPAVNALIDGEELVYNEFVDISIAVSTPKGLTTPVVRNAESLSMRELEMKVADLAKRGRDNKLTLDEMSGGTFTITNGGVFGSLMSTPIINAPQSAILGMHKIQERPVVVDGQIVIRPMMYLALSYDHRIIDGRESVSFLVRVKEMLERPVDLLVGGDPLKMLLELK
jgi:2-oxoglutarate dehydrogenase E2 component (dihydrolipoamide succinyltransferase)